MGRPKNPITISPPQLAVAAQVPQVTPAFAPILTQLSSIPPFVNPIATKFTQVLPDRHAIASITIALQLHLIRTQLARVVPQLHAVGPHLAGIGPDVACGPADVTWFCRRRRRANEQPASNKNDSLHDVLLAS